MATNSASTGSFHMRSTFHDAEPYYDYDKNIEETRRVMQGSSDPCASLQEMYTLINTLKLTRPTYTPRPCIEGFCWSYLVPFMAPHRSRIDRRVAVLSSEARTLHAPACQRFSAEKARQEERDFQMQLHQEELAARAQATSVTRETKTETRTGIFK